MVKLSGYAAIYLINLVTVRPLAIPPLIYHTELVLQAGK